MRYFLIAGEPSGDLHGANLMRGIRESDPAAEFRFWGGDKMAEVGGRENLGLHYRESSFFGFLQVVWNLFTILGQLKRCKREVKEYAPDVVILIDYAGFNLKIAKYAKSLGIKSYFYIAPKVWAWNEKRIEKIRRYVDELFIIFPFERKYFSDRGIEAHFEGNPLLDAIHDSCRDFRSIERFRLDNRLSQRPIVALLAGSRKSEIRANLPFMCSMSLDFPEYQFVVAGVDWIDGAEYRKCLAGSDIAYIEGQTYELVKLSVAAVVTSGTATLETALIGTPQVVLFKIPYLHEVLRPYVLKIPFVSLVNINLEREAVREIVTSSSDCKVVSDALREILPGGSRRQEVLSNYEELSIIIGKEGASGRFAARMVQLLRDER